MDNEIILYFHGELGSLLLNLLICSFCSARCVLEIQLAVDSGNKLQDW